MKLKFNFRCLLLIGLLVLSIFLVGCLPTEQNYTSSPALETFDTRTTLARQTHNKEQDLTKQKIITTGRLEVEIADLNEQDKEIEKLLANYSGYISNSRQYSANNRKFHSYTLRVPTDSFADVMSALQNLGEIKEKQITNDDVTEDYIDLEIRIENFKAQETRYRELLEKTETVEEILKIENELNRIRTEIERIQSRLDYYDSQVSLSTIQLRLSEPEPLFNDRRLPDTFRHAIQGFINSIHLVIIFIANLIPWLVLLAIFAFLGYKAIKKWKN